MKSHSQWVGKINEAERKAVRNNIVISIIVISFASICAIYFVWTLLDRVNTVQRTELQR